MRSVNGKSRSSKFQQGCKNSQFETQPGSLGDVARLSCEYGVNTVKVSRDDRDWGDTPSSAKRGDNQVDGKVIDQLAVKIESEILYHESQAHELRSRLNELRKLSGELEEINNSD